MTTRWDLLKQKLVGGSAVQAIPQTVAAAAARMLPKQEDRDNPLRLVPGEIVLLDTTSEANNRFVVTNIDIFERNQDGRDFGFTEYTLVDNLDTSEDTGGKYRYLRMIPKKDPVSDRMYHDTVLSTYAWNIEPGAEELRFSEQDFFARSQYYAWLAKQHFAEEDGADYAGYDRNGGLTTPYTAIVTERDESGEKHVRNVLFWDFTKWDGVRMSIWFFELNRDTRVYTAMNGVVINEDIIRPLRGTVLID